MWRFANWRLRSAPSRWELIQAVTIAAGGSSLAGLRISVELSEIA